MTKLFAVIAAIALSTGLGCTRQQLWEYSGPKAINGTHITCKGASVWREGSKYALRFYIRDGDKDRLTEVHGLDSVSISDDSKAEETCNNPGDLERKSVQQNEPEQ